MSKKNKNKNRISNIGNMFHSLPKEARLSIYMAVSIIQLLTLNRYKKIQHSDRIYRYIFGEYLTNNVDKNGQVDFNFSNIAHSFMKEKYEDFKDEEPLTLYKEYRKKDFKTLQEAVEYELTYAVQPNTYNKIIKSLS